MLLSFYFKVSYHDFEELLLMSQELRDVLTAAPDYSTLNRMYHRFRVDKMNEALLRALDNGGLVQEDAIRLDSTLLSPDPCQRLLSDPPRQAVQTPAERRVCRRRQHPDEAHGVGPSNDAPHLSALKRRAGRYGKREKSGHPVWVRLADSGFDSAAIGPRDIIPPIRRGGSLTPGAG
ncbi:MAG: hypothetical protein KatS3mg052_1248 [Candidatus Roseilinea sp.]|nr:MAG: hypothetical protein KatS3mg052_1248 [Candidatus Roseilinea sp.]